MDSPENTVYRCLLESGKAKCWDYTENQDADAWKKKKKFSTVLASYEWFLPRLTTNPLEILILVNVI